MSEEAQKPEGEEGAKPGRLVPLIVLIVCLLVGTGAGALVLGPKLFAAPAADAAAGEHGGEAEKGGGHGEGEAEASLVMLENLVVNPANSGGTRFLLISLAFEPGTADPAAITAAEPQLRDTFVTLLSRRTITELSDLALRDSIRAELLHAADSIVPGIAKLYIPQFVMQ